MDPSPSGFEFWGELAILGLIGIQVAFAVGFVWLVSTIANRKALAKTDARFQELEERIAGLEREATDDVGRDYGA